MTFRQRVVVIGTNLDEGTFFSSDDLVTTEAEYEAQVRALAPPIADALLTIYPATEYATPLAAFDAMIRDLMMVCPTRQLARALTAEGVDVRVYQVTQTNSAAIDLNLGVMHGIDLLYVFGNFVFPFARPSASEMTVRDAVQRYWTRFATSGDPNGGGAFAWPLYGAEETHLVIGDPLSTGAMLERDHCDAIDAIVP